MPGSILLTRERSRHGARRRGLRGGTFATRCIRAKRRGWLVSSVPTAEVVHQGGMSAASARAQSLVHLYESRRRLHQKHRGVAFRALASFITHVGLAQERRRLIRRPSDPDVEARLAGIERVLRSGRDAPVHLTRIDPVHSSVQNPTSTR